MSHRDDHRDPAVAREQLAEAVVFAHEQVPAQEAATPGSSLDRLGAGAKRPSDQDELSVLEATAALATAAFVRRKPAALPSSLQLRLAAAGLEFCAQRHPIDGPTAAPADTAAPQPGTALAVARRTRPQPIPVPARHRFDLVSWCGGTLLGLAAGLALWLLDPPNRADGPAAPLLSPAKQLASLLAADPGLLRLHWQHGSSPFRGEVTGEVVWSQQDQRGYLTFRGLPALDDDHRFQLWIVDGQREGAPVDGGLFAIRPGADTTVVPIDARLPIGKPAAFVVTVEGKDGAVVSKQEHVVAIASL